MKSTRKNRRGLQQTKKHHEPYSDKQYVHKALYQKKCEYGTGTFSKMNIPKGVVIIKETPEILNSENMDDVSGTSTEYGIKLIKQLLYHKKTQFIHLVPDHLDDTANVDYDSIREYHQRYLPELDQETMVLYYMKYKRNIFKFDDKHAILFTATKMNHSCNPHVSYYKRKNQMWFETVRPIKAGEEVFDSYIFTLDDRTVRQEALRRRYGFDCQCDKCSNNE